MYISHLWVGTASPNPSYPQEIENVSGEVQVKVENGLDSTATGYEEQTATFPLAIGQVLHIGDTLEDDGIHQRRDKYIFTGEETVGEAGTNQSGVYRLRMTVLRNLAKPASSNSTPANILCSSYEVISTDNTYARTKTGIGLNSGTADLFVYDTNYSSEGSSTNFKAFLTEQYNNGTPVIVEYEKAIPTVISYTAEQQTAYNSLKNLYSYKGITYISSTNEPSPVFEVVYRKSLG